MGRKDKVQLLLDHGADVHVRNLKGQSACEALSDSEAVGCESRRLWDPDSEWEEIVLMLSRHAVE